MTLRVGVGALAAALLLAAGPSARAATEADAPVYRLLFVGDVLLAREVAQEIDVRRGASPWMELSAELHHADLVMGNLEGSIGTPAQCGAPLELCFADEPRFLPFLKEAGFSAAGIANNHSGDLGAQGRLQTRAALTAAGVVPIGMPESPAFVSLGARTVAIVALNLVPGRDGAVDAIPSWQISQKLRLARAVADWTVVFVHWGQELADWVVPQQRGEAQWLIAQGADVIIGAHPHVVQAPECVDGRPVFFSLGNHVFDQKYAQTKRGMIADCRITGARLSCGALATQTVAGSFHPRLAGTADDTTLAGCTVPAGQPIASGGWTLRAWTPQRAIGTGQTVLQATSTAGSWRTSPGALVAAEFGKLASGRPPMLFTLERHPSSMDAEDGPRPYVYEVSEYGLVARWRGSALAWPLLDARLLAGADGRAYLCALHRGDSFLVPDPAQASSPHVFVYAWSGFGFSGRHDRAAMESCRRLFGQAPAQ
jgi:poly-gamma-glutamate synthesis protein (capsule biosynthesis protein)